MKVGIIGCGYVFDLYQATRAAHPALEIAGVWDINPARMKAVADAYGVACFESQEALLADPGVDMVVNLTPLGSHHPINLAALEAGKHIFCEKPLTGSLDEAKTLIAAAETRGLRVAVAPSNGLSSTCATLGHAIDAGLIGSPRLVYAEFDDGPIHLMGAESWVSPSGAPWPLREELETGCTFEHVGYHLATLCTLFGPVRAVTAFSSQVTPLKWPEPLETPDFSVACLDFWSGVRARVTCSIAGPRDHSLRVIGDTGQLRVATYKDYTCPVTYDRFDWHRLSVRGSRFAASGPVKHLLGAEDRIVPRAPGAGTHPLARGRMDMVAGIAAFAQALEENRPPPYGHDFVLHLCELTIIIQNAGEDGQCQALTTRFEPLKRAAAEGSLSGAAFLHCSKPSRRQMMAEKARRVMKRRRRVS